jgi:hypothetical protein
MKKLLLSLSALLAVSQMTANVNDENYTFRVRKGIMDLAGLAVVAPFAYFATAKYAGEEMFSRVTGQYLYLLEPTLGQVILPVAASQITTAAAAKAFSESMVRRTAHLDRNLALNVVEAAF